MNTNMKLQWAVYTDAVSNPGNPGGRKFIGYAGWHVARDEALAEAFNRYPIWEPARMSVSAI